MNTGDCICVLDEKSSRDIKDIKECSHLYSLPLD